MSICGDVARRIESPLNGCPMNGLTPSTSSTFVVASTPLTRIGSIPPSPPSTNSVRHQPAASLNVLVSAR
jgi:hypothetical protein